MGYLKKYFPLLLFLYCGQSYAQSVNDSFFNAYFLSSITLINSQTGGNLTLKAEDPAGLRELYIFLSPECPLCQNYSLVLNKLYREYGSRVKFYGIIPGRTYDAKTINGFAKKYKIAFPLFIDKKLVLSRYLQATATPEVILLKNRDELLYKGAIDDWFMDLGKQRTRATKEFLRDALDRQPGAEMTALKRTKAIGCYINDY